jgi:hypothetical protein
MSDEKKEFIVLDSALKHGFSEEEILFALRYPFVEIAYENDGCVMAYCGSDKNGNPLEILVDFEMEPPIVFHADRLTASFEKLIKSKIQRNER